MKLWILRALLAAFLLAMSGVALANNITISLASSQNPSLFGGAVTFAATVAPAPGGATAPTGIVMFFNGINFLGAGTLDNSGVACFGTGALAAGTNTITAVYGGDNNYAAGAAAALVQTNTGPGTVTVSNPSFEADVEPDGGYTVNTIISWSGTGSFGVLNPTAKQFAWATDAYWPNYGDLAGGSVSPDIAQGRNVAYLKNGSSISQTLNVTLAPNTSYVVTGAIGHGADGGIGPPAYVMLEANGVILQSNNIPDPCPYGNPASGIFAGWSLIYTAPSSGAQMGQAMQIVLGQSAPGECYFDNINCFSGLGSVTTLASSQNPSLLGSAVTFTATVAAAGGAPTGTVVFMNGANTLGVGILNASGVATFSTAGLAFANPPQAITAVYGGDAMFCGSVSGALSQTVSGLGNITINNPSFEENGPWDRGYTAGYIYQWVGSVPPGSEFGAFNPQDDTFPNSSATDAGGGLLPLPASGYCVAALSGAALSQTLTNVLTANATYTLTGALGERLNEPLGGAPVSVELLAANGDLLQSQAIPLPGEGNFAAWSLSYTAPASGPDIGQPIIITLLSGGTNFFLGGQADFDNIALSSGIATTTALSSSLNPSVNGASVVFTATVSAPLGGSAPSNGTVTFINGAATLGTGTVDSSGVATCAVSSLAVGTNNVFAVYGGGDNFGGSISSALPQVVVAANSAFSITSSCLDITGTNLVVCWQSVPGVIYTVVTNTSPAAPPCWPAASGPITASNTTTCFTLPGGIAGNANLFVVIKH